MLHLPDGTFRHEVSQPGSNFRMLLDHTCFGQLPLLCRIDKTSLVHTPKTMTILSSVLELIGFVPTSCVRINLGDTPLAYGTLGMSPWLIPQHLVKNPIRTRLTQVLSHCNCPKKGHCDSTADLPCSYFHA